MASSLSLDTQAVLLLCARLGEREEGPVKPLTTRQYSSLATWLHERSLRPGDLLRHSGRNQLADLTQNEASQEQIEQLLDRGTALAIMTERWTNIGIWVISRGDEAYPTRYKTYLQHKAPPVLYGVGEQDALQCGGLAVVGSREASEADLAYARKIGEACAMQRVCVVSGAAKGIDSEAMMSAIEQGGRSVGVLAEGLGRASVASRYRDAIMEGRLTLISPFDPDSRWFAFNAMERNKLVYALADAALVVACTDDKGGTWSGASEAMKHGRAPVFVKNTDDAPAGNRKLLQLGARELPPEAWTDISGLFAKDGRPAPLFEVQVGAVEVIDCVTADAGSAAPPPAPESLPPPTRGPDKDAYPRVLEMLLEVLQDPRDAQAVAQALDVVPTQAQAWLKRAVAEGSVRKLTNPVRYVAAAQSLFVMKASNQ